MVGTKNQKAILHLLESGIEEVIERSTLEKKLSSGKKLTVKLGADPSVPDLHLGHAVVLKKLKEFQTLGHKVVFIIGDFTAMIGDPSGRPAGRKPLGQAEISKNAKSYLEQVGKVLDVKKIIIRRNSEWFSKTKLEEFIKIAAHFSLRRLIDREDFQRRLRSGGEVGLHEGLYQVLQAYDSVAIGADVELGGYDQRLNLLAGRELQKKMGYPPQDIVIVPLLVGLDGSQKMSKSVGNYVGLLDPPEEMFGKVMSIPDSLIVHYAELAAFLEGDALKKLKEELKQSPFHAKKHVAEIIVRLYHGERGASRARKIFFQRFAGRGASPEAYEERVLPGRAHTLLDLVMILERTSSRSQARRLILDGAVELNRKVVTDPKFLVRLGEESIIRIGKKKFFKVVPK